MWKGGVDKFVTLRPPGPIVPVVVKTAAGEPRAAQSHNRDRAAQRSRTSRTLQPTRDHRATSRLDHPRTHKQTLPSKLVVSHPFGVALEVIRLQQLMRQLGVLSFEASQRRHQRRCAPRRLLLQPPRPTAARFSPAETRRQPPQVFAGVIQVDDLDRPGKYSCERFQIHEAPLSSDDLLARPATAALAGPRSRFAGRKRQRLGSRRCSWLSPRRGGPVRCRHSLFE